MTSILKAQNILERTNYCFSYVDFRLYLMAYEGTMLDFTNSTVSLNTAVESINESDIIKLSFTMKIWGTCLYLFVYICLWVAILALNILVILAFFQDQRLRRCPSNYFLLSLAIADLLTGLVALPLNLTVRLISSESTCYSTSRRYFFLPVIVFGGCSLLHLLIIALDR